MVFLGVYRAIYDYAPQGEGELEITEGDLLFVLEKSTDDDWWRAKKKAMSDEEDEPEGLIPNNYVEEAHPIYSAKALYDYTKQTDEELSFAEDAQLDVYDTSDEDWTLVGQNGQYGFAPAIYIEKASESASAAPAAPPMPSRNQVQQPTPEPEDESPPESPARNPAKALASIIAQRTGDAAPAAPPMPSAGPASPPLPSRGQQHPQYTPEESEEEAPLPRLPQRPQSAVQSPASEDFSTPPPPRIQEPPGVMTSPPYNRQVSDHYDDAQPSPAGGYHLYNIHEMVSSMGKNKKMPTTLGLNLARGLISIAPAKARDGPQQEWTADRLTHYSIEGKHVFMELVRPSKSIDFHAGAKDTAQEIVAQLGELAGASRAEGLREVMAASSGGGGGQKRGHMLYEFMAQGDDEVTVAVGDEIIVLDDQKSEEWWMVRRLKNGKEGVVPSSYVEVTGTIPQPEPQQSSYSGINAGRSMVEQNRLEEERATKEAARKHRKMQSEEFDDPGVGAQLPARQSSLAKGEKKQQKRKKDEAPKAKPNQARVRTWTDRSGAFRVDAEFLGLKDHKIHLHKDNGVKIAVPVGKMAIEDIEYVEKVTGVSLEDEKPLSEIKRRNTLRDKERNAKKDTNGISAGPKESDYDWFDFFLACNVNPQICERYAQNFAKDQMGEEILPDVTPALLRTLGLKEGDILRVMKYLDNKFGRANGTPTEGEASGGLFSGPSGALKNNTRKGRPAPAVQTNDVVDADAFKAKSGNESESAAPASAAETPLASAPAPKSSGFDDDAWSVKPVKSPAPQVAQTPKAPSPAPTPTSAAPVPQSAKLTGSMGELSLLSPALEPTPTGITPQAAQQPAPAAQAAPAQPQEQAKPAADPAFFDKLGAPAQQNILSQPTGRQRPMAPALNTTNSMIAPPPRAASAPGFPNQQHSAFAPPQPLSAQRTGFQNPMLTGYQAPPGQSLGALQQQQTMNGNMMSPYQQNGLAPQQTGYMPSPQMTGYYNQQPLQMQPTASPFADPISRPATGFQPTPTTMNQSFTPQNQFASPNAMLPPALTPMRTGFAPSPQQPQQQNGFVPQPTGFQSLQPQQTGFAPFQGASPSFASQQMPPQQLPPQQLPPQQLPPQQYMNGSMQQQVPMQTGFGAAAPLMPQKTGPPPPVRFGTAGGLKPLAPTPTGRRANLSNATPQNPFGF
ncbi:SH3 domain-containing protein 3 [Elsinoe fawcettii]|nr:SH3 domain-containing protein 3 [Elsinoe fawcettii]